MERMYKDVTKELRAEIADQAEYIEKLEAGLTEWAEQHKQLQESNKQLEEQYAADVPVVNAEVGFLSHIGVVKEDDDEEEGED